MGEAPAHDAVVPNLANHLKPGAVGIAEGDVVRQGRQAAGVRADVVALDAGAGTAGVAVDEDADQVVFRDDVARIEAAGPRRGIAGPIVAGPADDVVL